MQRERSSVSSRSRGTFGVRTRPRVAFRALSLYCANVISFWIWSECFQVFNDRVFLLGREHRSVFPAFVPWICRFIFAASLVIESTDVRNKSDLGLVEYIKPPVKNRGAFSARV